MRFESIGLRDGHMQSADGRYQFTRRVLPIVKGATAISDIGGREYADAPQLPRCSYCLHICMMSGYNSGWLGGDCVLCDNVSTT